MKKSIIFNHMTEGSHVETFNNQSEADSRAVFNILKTRNYLNHVKDNHGMNAIDNKTPVINIDQLLDHIIEEDYCLFCKSEIDNNVFGFSIKDNSEIMEYIQNFINALPKEAVRVSIFYVEIIDHPGLKSIYSIDYKSDSQNIDFDLS